MSETPIQPGGIRGPLPAQPGSTDAPKAARSEGPAFRLLLERLQEQAAKLKQTEPGGADELAGAVDAAGETLRGALDLKDRLLEAYRQSRHQADTRE